MVAANVAKGLIDLWTNPAPSDPLSIAKAVALSASLVAKGATSRKDIDTQISNLKQEKSKSKSGGFTAQYGMSTVLDEPTNILAGEAGAELINITPLEGPHLDGPQGGGVNINISGNVMSKEWVRDELIDELKEAVREGYSI